MTSKMKIVYVVTKSNFGGAQRYLFDLATSLPRDAYDVVVCFGPAPTGTWGVLADMLRAQGVRTHYIPDLVRDYSIPHDIRATRALVQFFRKEKPHVVHLNSSKAAGLGALAARIAGVPRIVFTVHGWPYWEPRSALWILVARAFSWLTVVLAHITICISEYDRRNMSWMPFVQRKARVIYNGMAPLSYLSRDEAREKLFSPEVRDAHRDDFWLVTNAELNRNKNILAGLEALARYNAAAERKVFYSLMGDGELRTHIEQHIDALGIRSHVSLLGYVPDGRMYMRAFDGFLLPSRKEGVPYVLLEAGGAALPVIASNVGGIPEVIANSHTGILVDPERVETIVEALQHLPTPEAKAMGEALRGHISRTFSLEHMLQTTRALYS